MHRGAMNRVRSEEAALSRYLECRGKPGPSFCVKRSAGRTRLNAAFDSKREAPCPRAERVGDSQSESIHGEPQPAKPRSGFAVEEITRKGTDDPGAFGLRSRVGTGIRSQWVPAPQSPPGSALRPTWSRTWQARPLLLREAQRVSAAGYTDLFSFPYLEIRPADSEPARHTEYNGHSAQVLRLRTPGQSPRMPRWLRAKS